MKNKLKIRQTEDCKVWFTSDTHFWHTNIIKYCDRPFDTIEEMVTTLIHNWNDVVRPSDIVFHLGDFAFCSSSQLKNLVTQLNGIIYLTMGNHDFKMFKYESTKQLFKDVEQQYYIEVDGQKIFLNHFPMLCYSGSWRKDNPTWQLFGHVHSGLNNLKGIDLPRLKWLLPYQYDVGVDNNNFTPVSFDYLKNIIFAKVDQIYEEII